MYVYPTATINFITYTALRWGQFPTITYTTGATAGSEVVTVAADLSDITIKISSGVSTNLQIQTAINASDVTVQSLKARDLISMSITGGHSSDTNTAVSATPLTGASFVFPPLDIPIFYAPLYIQQVYTGSHSNQSMAADLTLATFAGSSDGSNPKYQAAAMYNIFGDNLTADANYLAGVIGAYSITGVKASTYPSGAVLAQITDAVTDCDGAVVAYIDGDGDLTKANAAFKAMSNNSTAGSGFTYGLDLFGAAHDGFSELAILKADVRMSKEVCILNGAGAPTNAVTGAAFAQIGSLYIDRTNGKLYINTGTKASPTWTVVGTQS